MSNFKDLWLSCPEHIYIHWPFCKNKCHYCDFVSFQDHEGFEKKYHDALIKEIENFASKFSTKNKIKTIYLGGGTPSIYPLDLLDNLKLVLEKNFDLSSLQEFTIEVNPDGVTEKDIGFWKKIGINRISVGVQILNDNILKRLNRNQTEHDFLKFISLVEKYFDNISVDLILGLPGTKAKDWNYTLKKVLDFGIIKHISVYFLTVYDKTPLFFSLEKGELEALDEDKLIQLYDHTIDFLHNNGFDQYEISNFAKSGYQSMHNKAYWDRKEYKGFGLAASSFSVDCRFTNEKSLVKYFENPLSVGFQEKLAPGQIFMEKIMLGLRQTQGVGLHSMLYFLNDDNKNRFFDILKILKEKDFIEESGENIHLTKRGMFLENEVVLKILEVF